MSKYEFLRTLFPVKVSCEDPSVEYVCLPGRRLIYRDGKYVGWYNPRLRRAVK